VAKVDTGFKQLFHAKYGHLFTSWFLPSTAGGSFGEQTLAGTFSPHPGVTIEYDAKQRAPCNIIQESPSDCKQ
jgi:hypothetical protein